jgi:hypothetical protein
MEMSAFRRISGFKSIGSNNVYSPQIIEGFYSWPELMQHKERLYMSVIGNVVIEWSAHLRDNFL